jgi:hypothetical protein
MLENYAEKSPTLLIVALGDFEETLGSTASK